MTAIPTGLPQFTLWTRFVTLAVCCGCALPHRLIIGAILNDPEIAEPANEPLDEREAA